MFGSLVQRGGAAAERAVPKKAISERAKILSLTEEDGNDVTARQTPPAAKHVLHPSTCCIRRKTVLVIHAAKERPKVPKTQLLLYEESLVFFGI